MEQVNLRPRLHLEWIDKDAIEIIQKLQADGHIAYLVGGCVRDLLAGIPPKDFDIATTALPQQVRRLIANSYIIGKRFRLVLVKRQDKQFEVATFRKDYDPSELPEPPPGDNIFGTPEEDARRRDFSINAIMYDPLKNEIIDYCNGLKDLEDQIIRMIGNPNERLKEDPIRILRALRLAHKLRFTIEPSLRFALATDAEEITKSVLPRRREEILKILRLKEPFLAFQEAHDLGILKHLTPTLNELFLSPEAFKIFFYYLQRIHDLVDDPSQPIELFAVLSLAYYRSFVNSDPRAPIRVHEIMENPKLKSLFKNELGLFNYEQKLIAQALQMQFELSQTAPLMQKKDSKKAEVLTHEAFGIALLMASADYLISPAQLNTLRSEQDRLLKLKRPPARALGFR